MSRSWPYLSAVAVVGVLAGTAIGGKPVSRDEFVISPDQIPTTTLASNDTATSVPKGSASPALVTTTTTAASTATTIGPNRSTTTSTTTTFGTAGGTDSTG